MHKQVTGYTPDQIEIKKHEPALVPTKISSWRKAEVISAMMIGVGSLIISVCMVACVFFS